MCYIFLYLILFRNINYDSSTYLMVMVRSPEPLFFSTSILAPDTSRIAFMLLPPRPITRLIAAAGTWTFFDLEEQQFTVTSSEVRAIQILVY